MNTLADKAQENKSQSVVNPTRHKPSGAVSAFQFVDNRPDSVAHRNFQEIANNSPQVTQLMAFQETADEYSAQQEQPVQNDTGLPDNLKTGIENLSGVSLDDVRVHYHSEKPAQLQARAYTQWTDIHVAPGQEKHLPHEAWHVVQQKQGRVRPTIQMKGQVSLNDDTQLENEADVMGRKAARPSSVISRVPPASKTVSLHDARKAPIQRLTLLSYNPIHNRPDTDVIAGFNHARFPMTPNEVTLAALYSGYANVGAAPGNCKHYVAYNMIKNAVMNAIIPPTSANLAAAVNWLTTRPMHGAGGFAATPAAGGGFYALGPQPVPAIPPATPAAPGIPATYSEALLNTEVDDFIKNLANDPRNLYFRANSTGDNGGTTLDTPLGHGARTLHFELTRLNNYRNYLLGLGLVGV